MLAEAVGAEAQRQIEEASRKHEAINDEEHVPADALRTIGLGRRTAPRGHAQHKFEQVGGDEQHLQNVKENPGSVPEVYLEGRPQDVDADDGAHDVLESARACESLAQADEGRQLLEALFSDGPLGNAPRRIRGHAAPSAEAHGVPRAAGLRTVRKPRQRKAVRVGVDIQVAAIVVALPRFGGHCRFGGPIPAPRAAGRHGMRRTASRPCARMWKSLEPRPS
mmetsp:Transcript_168406/g.541058  ORF Transcript_168406/g.541058 Transcript_168406/m.541058 type:complete len:222 (+) Transcript_168406:1327-1992(+)